MGVAVGAGVGCGIAGVIGAGRCVRVGRGRLGGGLTSVGTILAAWSTELAGRSLGTATPEQATANNDRIAVEVRIRRMLNFMYWPVSGPAPMQPRARIDHIQETRLKQEEVTGPAAHLPFADP